MSARYIRFLTTETCSHMNNDVCPFCDFDRYWANRYPEDCPWADVSETTS